ncbi:MAG: DUF547 domain-containing protein [Flavobacteriaceae bacterium]|nr:DUF547 domain-containing protein [Flavobacteriaceae bacterium]
MKKPIAFLTFLALMFFGISNAQIQQKFFDDANSFFSSYVSNGAVDYKAIHSDPSDLESLLNDAKEVSVSVSSPNEYRAFWINAYNLSVIKGIIDNYPINSPLDKKGFFDKIKYEVGGTSITLNDIENNKLRAKFDDARVHFVLVCGAKGCPPIISKAYTPENVETILEQQTIKAVNNSSFIKVSAKKVALSEIFKWYKEDFVNDNQTEIDFLNKYRKEKIQDNAKITYYSYDWRLNSK